MYFLSPSFAAFVASTAGVLKERIERFVMQDRFGEKYGDLYEKIAAVA